MTFTNVNTSYNLPNGFFLSSDAPNPKWVYYVNSAGAGIRVMPTMGTVTPNEYGHIGIAWISQLNNIPFTGDVSFTSSLTVCDGVNCSPLTLSGSLKYGVQGLIWSLIPNAQTLLLGNTFYHVVPQLSTGTGVIVPRDVAFTVNTPEPVSLVLLGSGLGILGLRLRKRKDAN